MALDSIRRFRDKVFGSLWKPKAQGARRDVTDEELKAQFTFSRKPRASRKADSAPGHADSADEQRRDTPGHHQALLNQENDAPTRGRASKDKASIALSTTAPVSLRGDQLPITDPSFTSKTSTESNDIFEDTTPYQEHTSNTHTTAAASSSIMQATTDEQSPPRKQAYIHPRARANAVSWVADSEVAVAKPAQKTTPSAREEREALMEEVAWGDISSDESDVRTAQASSPAGKDVEVAAGQSLDHVSDPDSKAKVEGLVSDAVTSSPVTALEDHKEEHHIKPASPVNTTPCLGSTSTIVPEQVMTTDATAAQLAEAMPLLSLVQPDETTTSYPALPMKIEPAQQTIGAGVDHALVEQSGETVAGADPDSLSDGEVIESKGVSLGVLRLSSDNINITHAPTEEAESLKSIKKLDGLAPDNDKSPSPGAADAEPTNLIAEKTEDSADSTEDPPYWTRRLYRFNPYGKLDPVDNIVPTRKPEGEEDLHPAYLKVKTDLHLAGLGQPYLSKSAKPVPQSKMEVTPPAPRYITPGERRKFNAAVNAELKRGGIVKL